MRPLNTDTVVLGGNFMGHDSAVFAILPDKNKVFGIETERLTRYKHDSLPPVLSIKKFIGYERIDVAKVKKVVFCQMSLGLRDTQFLEHIYEREVSLRKHSRSMYKSDIEKFRKWYTQLGFVEKLVNTCKTKQGWYLLYLKILLLLGVSKKISGDTLIKKHLRSLFPHSEIEVRYYDHEYCHIVSATATSSFKNATIISIDGWGEGFFSKVYTLNENSGLNEFAESAAYADVEVGHGKRVLCSVGGIYIYFTEMLGFAPNADEGKVEALAAYGKPVSILLEQILGAVSIDDEKNSISIDKAKLGSALDYDRFEKYLKTNSKEDLAATVQKFLEDITLRYIRLILQKTGLKHLALAGGVTANVINNLRIYEQLTEELHITPAIADDGAAQGAACAYLLETGWDVQSIQKLFHGMPYYGTSYTRDEVLQSLKKHEETITIEDLGDQWPEQTAQMVVSGKIGAIFHGRMEWGPRALGNRSIIADPRKKDFREIINLKIKRRPAFQPFCPSVLVEEKERLFDKSYLNKHMTCAFNLKKEFWGALPSAAHIDGTARVQFVEHNDNQNYYRLLKKVQELTGMGVVINTSFNKHGRTIVESPEDAVTDFLDTDMDYLVIEGILVKRKK